MAKTQTKAYIGVKPIVLPDDASPEWCSVQIEFSDTAYASGDLIQALVLPEGFRCLDWFLSFPDIDSNATPAIAWSLGVSNATLAAPVSTDIGSEVWGTALTAGQTVAIVRNTTNVSAQGQVFTTSTLSGNREIVLKCTAAAGTYAGAGLIGHLVLLLRG